MPEAQQVQPRLRASTARNVVRLLVDCGYSDGEIDYGLDYAETEGARTMMECFTLAVSRLIYSDEQLAAKMRFNFRDFLEADPHCLAAGLLNAR